MKRGFDIVVAAALLVLSAPVWLLAALVIKAHDGGPVLFRQARVGRCQRQFTLLKFRSMIMDAEARGGHQTVQGDPRVTPVGRWLRRSSVDELPQLWNVLRGDMSLVGPRPDTPGQADGYAPEDWAMRCSVRPGLTGLAQVRHKRGTETKTRLELDLEYIRSWNFRLDLRILALTALKVVRLDNR